MILRQREHLIDENGNLILTNGVLEQCLQEHANFEKPILNNKLNRYKGTYMALDKNKQATIPTLINKVSQIVDSISSYTYAKPVSYITNDSNFQFLLDWYTGDMHEDRLNNQVGKYQSLYGKTYELVKFERVSDFDDSLMPFVYKLDSRNTFVVKECELGNRPICGVTYNEVYKTDGRTIDYYNVFVYTNKMIYTLKTDSEFGQLTLMDSKPHILKGIPLYELLNNEEELGDCDRVFGLIDLLNELSLGRVTDKRNFLKRLCTVTNGLLGRTDEEVQKNIKSMEQGGLVILYGVPDENGKLSTPSLDFKSDTFNEQDQQILTDFIEKQIYAIAKVYNANDEHFSGNSSGIAMQYKLIPTEELSGVKQTYFEEFLRYRLRLINEGLKNIYGISFDVDDISIIMTRNIPVDKEAKLKEFLDTKGELSWRTRVQRYDENIDVEEERKRLMEEKKEEALIMSQAYDVMGVNSKNELKEEINNKEENNLNNENDKQDK